jgi:hypothetical protein
MKSLRSFFALFLSLPLAAAATFGVPACDPSGQGTTTGKPVTHATRLECADDLSQPIVNAKGWSVSITHAYLAIESLRTFDGAPVTASWSPPDRPRWAHWLAIPEAHAHPGHYTPGSALGEMLDAASVDLVVAPTDLGPSNGFTGTYRSAEFAFGASAKGAFAPELGDDVVRIEGSATMGATTIDFVVTANAADVVNTDTPPAPAVEGCAFAEEYVVTAPGTVVVRVLPSVWVDQIDFADVLPVPAPGEVVTLDGTAKKAFVRGVVKGAAYSFVFEP